MFSTGQLVFAAFFAVGFISLIVLAYKKDRALHKRYFKGARWVLVAFIAFVALLSVLKALLRP